MLTVNGYLSYLILQGSITSTIFEAFVEEQVLPHCTPYPGPRSVLILDNASIHNSTRLQGLCKEYGVLLKFLPPCSPDFSSIEATFNDTKAWIKRNHRLMENFTSFEAFLHFSIGQVCSTHARDPFKEAGYIVT